MLSLAQKIDSRLQDNEPSLRRNPAGPFPNLRCREIVKDIVDAVVDSTTHCKLTDDQAYWFALGIVRGAWIVTQRDATRETELFVVELLQRFNERGVSALRELVVTVTGQDLPCAA